MSIGPQLNYEIKHPSLKIFEVVPSPDFYIRFGQVGWNIQGCLLFLPSTCGLYPNLNKSSGMDDGCASYNLIFKNEKHYRRGSLRESNLLSSISHR
jgi:hypothetical protein